MLGPELRLEDLPSEPEPVLAAWFTAARDWEEIRYPHAMCLATVSPEGWPEARFVLVHGLERGEALFLSDQRSAKGRALKALPRAALTVYWEPLERQVRLRGEVQLAPAELANELFRERPAASRVTAWASAQSEVVADRRELEAEMARFDAYLWDEPDRSGMEIPRPPHWLAWRLVPDEVEFWLARARRLHDRIRYRRLDGGGWQRERLAP